MRGLTHNELSPETTLHDLSAGQGELLITDHLLVFSSRMPPPRPAKPRVPDPTLSHRPPFPFCPDSLVYVGFPRVHRGPNSVILAGFIIGL